MNKLNVFILTEGGRKIGFGHLSRCIALAKEIKKRSVKIILEFVINKDKYASEFLKEHGMRAIPLNWTVNKPRIFQLLKNARLVIIDSYLAPAEIYTFIKNLPRKPFTIAMDDYQRINYDADKIIKPIFSREKKSNFAILRREFRLNKRKNIRKDIKNILITFGGTDLGDFAIRLLRTLVDKYPYFNYHVVLGASGGVLNKRMEFAKNDRVKFYFNLSAGYLRGLMIKCDLAISGGGQTLNELAAMGMPTIAICLSENQEFNLAKLKKAGFATFAGWYNEENIFKNVTLLLKGLSLRKKRLSASRKGRRAIDGKGASRIADVIFKEMETFVNVRRAEKEDSFYIWQWRNHPRVRQRSLSPRYIPYEEHKKWFNKFINSDKAVFYIGKTAINDRIGQVRFMMEKDRRKSLISVNLNPRFFGKGLGNKIIAAGTRTFITENPFSKEIRAEILRDNSASIGAFKKAGYLFYGDRTKKGNKISILKYKCGSKR